MAEISDKEYASTPLDTPGPIPPPTDNHDRTLPNTVGNRLLAENERLRLALGQVLMLIDARALNFVRDDAETRRILNRWREARALAETARSRTYR